MDKKLNTDRQSILSKDHRLRRDLIAAGLSSLLVLGLFALALVVAMWGWG